MSLKVLIIEDEHLGMERLRKHLQDMVPLVEVTGAADSVRASVAWLRSNPSPDLILMDIDLGDGQSFDIFNEVTIESQVIFTLSYDEYAIKAFRSNNIHYLMKPIKKAELANLLETLSYIHVGGHAESSKTNIENLVKELQQHLYPKEYRQRFLVKLGKKRVSVELHEISYFFVEKQFSYLQTKSSGEYALDYTMEELEHMLPPGLFFRISSSYLVTRECISSINRFLDGHLVLSLSPVRKKTIVDRDKVQPFRAWMKKYPA